MTFTQWAIMMTAACGVLSVARTLRLQFDR